jgi:hypothetical protein
MKPPWGRLSMLRPSDSYLGFCYRSFSFLFLLSWPRLCIISSLHDYKKGSHGALSATKASSASHKALALLSLHITECCFLHCTLHIQVIFTILLNLPMSPF